MRREGRRMLSQLSQCCDIISGWDVPILSPLTHKARDNWTLPLLWLSFQYFPAPPLAYWSSVLITHTFFFFSVDSHSLFSLAYFPTPGTVVLRALHPHFYCHVFSLGLAWFQNNILSNMHTKSHSEGKWGAMNAMWTMSGWTKFLPTFESFLQMPHFRKQFESQQA